MNQRILLDLKLKKSLIINIMDREIKFRAWDKNRKCMEDIVNTKFFVGNLQKIEISQNEDEIVLMQYTGLKTDQEKKSMKEMF